MYYSQKFKTEMKDRWNLQSQGLIINSNKQLLKLEKKEIQNRKERQNATELRNK